MLYKNRLQFYGKGGYYDGKRLTEVRTSLKSLKQYDLISSYAVRIETIIPIELTKANLNPQKLDFQCQHRGIPLRESNREVKKK